MEMAFLHSSHGKSLEHIIPGRNTLPNRIPITVNIASYLLFCLVSARFTIPVPSRNTIKCWIFRVPWRECYEPLAFSQLTTVKKRNSAKSS